MKTWIEIILQIPIFFALLVLIIIIGIVIGAIYYLRRFRVRNFILSSTLDKLQQENEELVKLRATWEKLSESYRQFIYNVSHEVSNPLQSIQTNLDNMAKLSPDEMARWKQYHAIIASEIRRIIRLTDNLRLLSKLETDAAPIRREPVNIKSVIEDVLMYQFEDAEVRKIQISYQGPNQPARVLGNREQLKQVLMNLIDNAIKYSNDDGGEVFVNVTEEQESLHLRVIDDGIGIPEDDLPHIFETAYRSPESRRTKSRSTGLGLAIVKRIIEQHEGEIHITSKYGLETTISITLPIFTPASS